MSDLITVYSELIEDIVNGTFTKKVLTQRSPIIIKDIIDQLQVILTENPESANDKLTLNLLQFVDSRNEEMTKTNNKLPIDYQTYFFTRDDEAMELINDFVVNANAAFAAEKVQASITTAKVAARLRGQFLHELTSEKFLAADMELLVVNNGLVTFKIENPNKTIEMLKQHSY